jgi:hypothetical protein
MPIRHMRPIQLFPSSRKRPAYPSAESPFDHSDGTPSQPLTVLTPSLQCRWWCVLILLAHGEDISHLLYFSISCLPCCTPAAALPCREPPLQALPAIALMHPRSVVVWSSSSGHRSLWLPSQSSIAKRHCTVHPKHHAPHRHRLALVELQTSRRADENRTDELALSDPTIGCHRPPVTCYALDLLDASVL